MDTFVIRKRKRTPSSPDHPAPAAVLRDKHDNEPTDVKLAILASRFPAADTDALLDLLTVSNGSVPLAAAALRAAAAYDAKKRPGGGVGMQATLRQFRIAAADTQQGSAAAAGRKLAPRKGETLHLYDANHVAAYTPCTIIHNFLPADQADALLMELVNEAKTFEPQKFKLFDNVCQSPHTSAFFVESYDEIRRQQTEYIYNGRRIKDVRQLTPQLTAVKPLVADTVNAAIQTRIAASPTQAKLRFQSPDAWTPNVALVNCYRGARESVGWHSDQLTYLGPRAVIGSLSLGVAREFRVRRIMAREASQQQASRPGGDDGNDDGDDDKDNDGEKDNDKDNGDEQRTAQEDTGQISIHLPHNSLLIMHADMQEDWKHTIAPAQTIDAHPLAGNVRINVTYRDYKEYMHPRYTPRCKCNTPCVLRVVQRKRGSKGRYFWMCYADNVPGQPGCDFFAWAQFDDDGRPVNGQMGGGEEKGKEKGEKKGDREEKEEKGKDREEHKSGW